MSEVLRVIWPYVVGFCFGWFVLGPLLLGRRRLSDLSSWFGAQFRGRQYRRDHGYVWWPVVVLRMPGEVIAAVGNCLVFVGVLVSYGWTAARDEWRGL